MADATVALAAKPFPYGVDNTQRRQIIYGTATITANAGTGPATGLPLNWWAVSNPSGGTIAPEVGPGVTTPDFVTFQGQGSESTVEQLYSFDYTNNSLLVWRAGAFVTTGIVADTVEFKAEFVRGV